MFDVGATVLNSVTGHYGKVIGYGHQILAYGYMPTLKVLVMEGTIEEDLSSVWTEY
jgi:hypothetical protein